MTKELTAKPLRLATADAAFDAQLQQRLRVDEASNDALVAQVRDIIAQVRARGDAAVLEYTMRWDRVQAQSMAELEIAPSALKAAFDALPPSLSASA